MSFYPLLGAQRRKVYGAAVENTTPASWIIVFPGMSVYPLNTLIAEPGPVQITEKQILWGGGEEEEFFRLNFADNLMNENKSVYHGDNLGGLEDVKFIEGKLVKILKERVNNLVWGIPLFPCTDIVLLHYVMENVGIGEYEVVVIQRLVNASFLFSRVSSALASRRAASRCVLRSSSLSHKQSVRSV